jgi:branched-chain amino acid transport system substrate-binding protein
MRRLFVLAAAVLAGWSAAPAQAAGGLRVYSSFPLAGGENFFMQDIVRAIDLALAENGGRAGAFSIDHVSMDSADAKTGGFDFDRTEANARRAAADPRTVLYLGEFNSGPTRFAIPILNDANISQISTSTTYDGLTIDSPGNDEGHPDSLYPTGKRTFIRLVPPDEVQGAALATEMLEDGCARTAIGDNGPGYGEGLARSAENHAQRLGLNLVLVGRGLRSRDVQSFADGAGAAHADCFMWAGFGDGVAFMKAVAKHLPAVRLYAGDGACEDGVTRALRELAARFECSNAARPNDSYAGGAGFAQRFTAAYGFEPLPFAINAYEAMRLGLDTIAKLGSRADRREVVRQALFATRNRTSVLGTYSILPSGDTTIRLFGVYRGTAGGLAFDHTVLAR